MPEPLIARKKLLGASLEVTKGTAVLPTVPLADTLIYDARMIPVDFYTDGQRKPQGHHMGSIQSVKGPTMGRLTFRTEMIFQDATLFLLQGGGFLLSGAGPNIADPSSDLSDHETITFRLWEDGRVKVLSGAVLSSWSVENGGPGQRVFINWEFQGIFGTVIDAAMPAYASGNPVVTNIGYRAASMVATIGGSSFPNFPTFSLDLGIESEMREDLESPSALFHGVVLEMGPTLTVPSEARLVADLDTYGLHDAGTLAALVLTFSDGSNTMSITGPSLQRESIDDQDQGKRLADAVTFRLHNSGAPAAGQDHINFTESFP